MAAISCSDDCVCALLHAGADSLIYHPSTVVGGNANVNQVDEVDEKGFRCGLTLLHVCAENGLYQACQLIVSQNSTTTKIRTERPYSNTPMELAAMSGNRSVVELLHKYSEDYTDADASTVDSILSDGPRLLSVWTSLHAEAQAKSQSVQLNNNDIKKQTTRTLEPTEPCNDESQIMAAEEHKLLGNAAYKNKQYDTAVREYTAAIVLDGSNHLYWSNRSVSFAALGKSDDALLDAEVCRGLQPEWPKGCYRLATARLAARLGR